MFHKLGSLALTLTLSGLAAEHGATRVPVLVELFTSEGCSSCPPADRLLQVLDQQQPVAGAEVIVLSEHVDYWDRLGWKDPFSSSKNTARQQDYAARFRGDGVYTPQMVVDGRFGFVGSDGREAQSAIQKAIQEPKAALLISNVARDGNQVSARIEIPAGQANRGVLYCAIADDRAESRVTRGENSGNTLTHVAVARVLNQIGPAEASRTVSLKLPADAQPGRSRLVAFVQDPQTDRILAVAAQTF